MTRTQVQIPDILFGRVRRYAECRETSIADVFRNALELFITVHAVEGVAKQPERWSPPVCRSTGLVADPVVDEDWRERIYSDHGE